MAATAAFALWCTLASGVPQVLVLPLEGRNDVGDLGGDALGYQLSQALTRTGRTAMTDPAADACTTDACALMAGRAIQASHVLFGARSGDRLNVYCVSTLDGERVGELLDLPLDGAWATRAAELVPPLEEPAAAEVPLWGTASALVKPAERWIPTEDRTLRLIGGIASGVGFGGIALGLLILATGAASGTLLSAYAQVGGLGVLQKTVLFIISGVGAAGAGFVGVTLLVTMVPLLVAGVVLLLWAGVLD